VANILRSYIIICSKNFLYHAVASQCSWPCETRTVSAGSKVSVCCPQSCKVSVCCS